MKLNDTVCIVTGAGKGIGREVAKLFYKNGACLALITRTGIDLTSLKEELKSSDERIFIFEGDVSHEKTVIRFVKEVIRKFGKADILINNAGMRFRRAFLDITTKEWNKVINTNLNSVYFLCREVGRNMVLRKKGAIVNIASIIGTHGLPELAAYGASKGGVITLTKCLALEWAKDNVRVNAIAPGFCETSYAEKFKKNNKLYKFTLERTPQGKWGSALDVAEACIFLSTAPSRFITGEVLHVDGGWSAW